MKLLATLAALCLSTVTLAQSPFTDPANLRGERVAPLTGRELPIDQGASGLQQLLRKLNTRASILNVVAHPDDEDGGMMALYSRGLGARVADISLTRGEGGQNAVTADFEDALGLLRTQELLSSDRYPLVDQFFGTEVDFGFSKTKEESFAKWTHERVLYDVVRAIRLYRPLVLTSTWIGGVTDGHGQHQVSGQIAQEAFVAAGDPKVFPELTAEGILPWQPLRIYARVPMQSISERGLFDYATGQYTPARFTNYVTGEVTTTPPTTDVVVHEGTPDPLLADETGKPRSYIQFARIGLGLQRSQVGPGVRNAPSGAFDVAYHLYGSRVPQTASISDNTTSNTTPNSVISTGGALLRRSGEIPVLAFPDTATNPGALPFAHLQRVGYRAKLDRSPSQDPNFFTNIDTSIESISTLAPNAPSYLHESLSIISAQIAQATTAFNPKDPSAIAPILGDTLSKLDALIPRIQSASFGTTQRENVLHELRIKQVQLNDALVLALGLHIEATTNETVTTNSSVPIFLSVTTNSNFPIDYLREKLVSSSGRFSASTPAGSHITKTAPYHDKLTAAPALTKNETRPYFHRDSIERPVYDLTIPALRNAPATPPALTAWVDLDYKGVTLTVGAVTRTDHFETIGDPVSIVPAISLTPRVRSQVLLKDASSLKVGIDFTGDFHNLQELADSSFSLIPPDSTKPTHVTLVLKTPPGWQVHPSGPIYRTRSTGPKPDTNYFHITDTSFDIHIPSLSKPSTIQFEATTETTTYTEGYREVGYPGLPITNYFTPATTRIVPVDLKLPAHHNIAYLPGTGDAIPEALASINLKPTILTISDLTPDHLKQFDTIILGVRAYNAHPDLHGAPTQALLDYARNGGNVVVQYQTPEFTAEDAPYPLSLGSNEKVVDETAPVHLLDAKFPLLSQPNLITSADFDNWIEERGHGFLSTWDPHYTALTETHDPGQSPQRGGLITTPLGKGRWTYCAFALYRQLPEAVPGAYRLFLNLLNP